MIIFLFFLFQLCCCKCRLFIIITYVIISLWWWYFRFCRWIIRSIWLLRLNWLIVRTRWMIRYWRRCSWCRMVIIAIVSLKIKLKSSILFITYTFAPFHYYCYHNKLNIYRSMQLQPRNRKVKLKQR